MSDEKESKVKGTEEVLCRRKFKTEDGDLVSAGDTVKISKALYSKLSKNGVVTKDL
jgi:hypothetical protein